MRNHALPVAALLFLIGVLSGTPAVSQAVMRLFGTDATSGAAVPIAAESNRLLVTNDGVAATQTATSYRVTAGSGTGITIADAGTITQQVYKITIGYTQFTTNGVTHDVTIATLPAKTFAVHVLADVTQVFACAVTCTSTTLSMTVGTTTPFNQYLVTFDVDAATAQFGDAAAELGASLTEATIPTTIGALGSWSTTQAVTLRMTSGTGALGNGTVTNLNAGSVTVYLTTVRMP